MESTDEFTPSCLTMRHRPFILCFLLLTSTLCVLADGRVTISGFVMDQNSRAIELGTVSTHNGAHSTTTDDKGFYSLSLPSTDTIVLHYRCLSYQPAVRIVPIDRTDLRVNVMLGIHSKNLNEVVVKSQQRRINALETLDAKAIRLMPDASGGSIEALLVTFAGVSSNNELSTQYSVRGGNYDENLVYVNGIEVYRPLLIRAGQQEGLSFINPEMVHEVRFSAGGFNANYGDKMSSVLDITYREPDSIEAVASLSLLGANLYVGHRSKNGRFSQLHGLRYKTNAYLLGTLDTKGEYDPSFLDYQTHLTWRLRPHTELRFLGNVSGNTFRFMPKSRNTEYGTFNQKYNLFVAFDGQEKDRFETTFGALTLSRAVNEHLKLQWQTSVFRTVEEETYDITGQYWLSATPIRNNRVDTASTALLGIGTYHEHARNHLTASVIHLSHTGEWSLDGHRLQWGLGYQRELITDRIREWDMIDSSGYALPYSDATIYLLHNLKVETNMASNRVTAYLQDTWRFRRSAGLFVLTGGLRLNHWDYNGETLISPRVTASFLPAWNTDMAFRLAAGVYYQAPFYKELRDTVTVNGVTHVHLNQHIKAQQSLQVIAGMDYHFNWVDRPFKLTTELYYKDMRRLVPYTVDNVRIRYMGRNLSEGHTAGLDVKLFGEFVQGTDSWVSLSLIRSRETIDGVTVPRPNEQRYNVSVFFQDYFPSDPRYTVSLKLIWADGLPFGPPDSDKGMATLRMAPYRRVDLGMSRIFSPDTDAFMHRSFLRHASRIWLGVDSFNLLDIKNVNAYYWVTDISNKQWAVPNYLTGRLFNLRLTAEF